jgi:hypothetical protein
MKRKKRGLGKGLSALIDSESTKPSLRELASGFIDKAAKKHKLMLGVLRTKGGSGESHTVGVMIEVLANLGCKTLVVSQWPDRSIESYAGEVWVPGVTGEGMSACYISRWDDFLTSDAENFLESDFDAIIFTEGTSAGVDPGIVLDLSDIASLVFMSVNSDVYDSIIPMKHISESLLNLNPTLIEKVFSFCWFEEWQGASKKKHFFRVAGMADYVDELCIYEKPVMRLSESDEYARLVAMISDAVYSVKARVE